MRSTENWSDGVAPLNLRVEFIKNLYDNEGNFYEDTRFNNGST